MSRLLYWVAHFSILIFRLARQNPFLEALAIFHILLHFICPAIVAAGFYRQQWRKAYLVMMITMLIDLDHLLATPIYDPNRCSIGFHPLHQFGFIAFYAALCLHTKTRLVGLGLLIHMLLDSIDCKYNLGIWFV